MDKSLAPTRPYVLTALVALGIGIFTYLIGLINANLQFNEKGYYFVVLVFGLFSVITLQKTIRDEAEGLKVTSAYKNLNIFCVITACALIFIGLYNVDTLLLNEKGFFGIAFVMSLFSSIVVQKNVRDLAYFKSSSKSEYKSSIETLE
ncbi:inner membrane protein YiaA, partial [Vibrio anguillarum]